MKTSSNSFNVVCVLIVALLSSAAFGTLVTADPSTDGTAVAPWAQDAVSARPAVPSHPAGKST